MSAMLRPSLAELRRQARELELCESKLVSELLDERDDLMVEVAKLSTMLDESEAELERAKAGVLALYSEGPAS